MEEKVNNGEFSYKMSADETENFIHLRAASEGLFTGRRHSAKAAWSIIQEELGLEGKMTPTQLKKKWENLKKKYKDLKYPPVGAATEAAISWRWFKHMEEALGGEQEESGTMAATPPGDSSLMSEYTSGLLPSKRMCRVQVGGDILELLSNPVHSTCGATSLTVEDPSGAADRDGAVLVFQDEGDGSDGGRPSAEDAATLRTERQNLCRERQQLEKDQNELERERVLLERERGLAEREYVTMRRDRAQLEKDRAALERERASLEQDRARLERDWAVLERERASLEQDRARLERDRAALAREREEVNATILTRGTRERNGPDAPCEEDRKRLMSLFEKLIDKF